MELGLLEQKLRSLPGVLDCAVSAEGVAVVVHPEVDPRLIELHAQVLLAEAGDRRPLLVVGGMTVGPRVLPSGRPARAPKPGRTGHSPLSLAGFALLVLALLAVVPIAGRDRGSDRVASPASERPAAGLGRVPVVDEAVVDEAPTPPSVFEPVQPVQPAVATPTSPAPARAEEPGSVVRLAAVTPAPVPAVVVPVMREPAPAAPVLGKHAKKDRGHGWKQAGRVYAGGAHDSGKADSPGRRHGPKPKHNR